jgi:hypothetical protein
MVEIVAMVEKLSLGSFRAFGKGLWLGGAMTPEKFSGFGGPFTLTELNDLGRGISCKTLVLSEISRDMPESR